MQDLKKITEGLPLVPLPPPKVWKFCLILLDFYFRLVVSIFLLIKMLQKTYKTFWFSMFGRFDWIREFKPKLIKEFCVSHSLLLVKLSDIVMKEELNGEIDVEAYAEVEIFWLIIYFCLRSHLYFGARGWYHSWKSFKPEYKTLALWKAASLPPSKYPHQQYL